MGKEVKGFLCGQCVRGKKGRKVFFSSKGNLRRHIELLHSDSYKCDTCGADFPNGFLLGAHVRRSHSAAAAYSKKAGRKTGYYHPKTGQHFLKKSRIFSSKLCLFQYDASAFFLEDLLETLKQEGVELRESHEKSGGGSRSSQIYCPFCRANGGGVEPNLRSRSELLSHLNFLHYKELGIDSKLMSDETARRGSIGVLTEYLAQRGIRVRGEGGGTNRATIPGLEDEADEDPEEDDQEILDEMIFIRKKLTPFIHSRPMDFFKLIQERVDSKSNKFRLKSSSFDLILSSEGRAAAVFGLGLELVEAMSEHLISRVVPGQAAGVDGGDPVYVSLAIEAKNQLSFPIASPYLIPNKESIQLFLADIANVYTSNHKLFLDRELTVGVSVLGGEGRERDGSMRRKVFGSLRRSQVGTEVEYVLRKRGVRSFRSVAFPFDCLASSVIFGLAHNEAPGTFLSSSMGRRPEKSPSFVKRVQQLCEALAEKIDWTRKQDVSACATMQNYLNEAHQTQLIIFDGLDTPKFFFCGKPHRPALRQRIHLCLHQEHLFYIPFPRSFLSKACPGCLKVFSGGGHKICSGWGQQRPSKCGNCESQGFCRQKAGEIRFCDRCEGEFHGDECYERHLEEGAGGELSVCARKRVCPNCAVKVDRLAPFSREIHPHPNCLKNWRCSRCCTVTDLSLGTPHYCLVQPGTLQELGISRQWAERRAISFLDTKSASIINEGKECVKESVNLSQDYPKIVGRKRIVLFDFETRVPAYHGDGELEVFCVSSIDCCTECCYEDFLVTGTWEKKHFPCCGERIKDYYGALALNEFVHDLFFSERSKMPTVGFAHNGSGFDFQFLARRLALLRHKPELITKGRKILRMKLGNVVLKDLFLIFSSKLSTISKSFGFEHVALKSRFPFLLSNCVDVENYVSEKWPEEEFYQVHLSRSYSEIEELRRFIRSKKGALFDFKKECMAYCRNDSILLCMGVLSLESATLRETDYKLSFIFSKPFTIAGISALYYRSCFMRPRSIGVLPVGGIYSRKRTSALAISYFAHLNEDRVAAGRSPIRYSHSPDGEFCWLRKSVDGWCPEEIIEVQGCTYHAHQCIFPDSKSPHPIYRIPCGQVRKLDAIRAHRIEQALQKPLRRVWECEIRRKMKTDMRLASLYQQHLKLVQTPRPVDCRLALFGSRHPFLYREN